MKKALSILTTLAVATAIIGGCGNQADEENTRTGANIAALTATDSDSNTYCISGNIEIYYDNNGNGALDGGESLVGPVIPTGCSNTSHPVPLLPGNYIVRIPNPVCTSSLDNVDDCFLVPEFTAFTVTENVVVLVPLQAVFQFENDQDHNILFNIGGASISTLPPENQERCGTGPSAPICEPDQACANVDGTGYVCYDNCSPSLGAGGAGGAGPGSAVCAGDETCSAVGYQTIDQLATNPALIPVPVQIGVEGDIADGAWLCLPNAAAGGAGGSAGSTP